MEQMMTVERIKKNLETGGFYLNCRIPLGYRSVFPVLQVKNRSLCITFLYLKYQTTGEVDKTLVYPIRYAISLELPTERIIGFEDFEHSETFRDIDFDKPIGYFRHEAVRQYDRTEYDSLYHELMREYDKVIQLLLEGGEYGLSDGRRMSELLRLLLEPSLLPMYQVIDKDFYNQFLAERKVPVKAETLRIGKAAETVLADSKKALEAAGFQSLAVELEKIRRSAERERFTIAVVGEFSRGKSTLINKLLGKNFLPEGNLPTTAVMTRIRHHDREVIMAFDENNKKVLERELSQESWEGLTAQNFGGEDFRGNVLVGVNSEWLRDRNVELIDTPGAGDLSEARAKVVGDALLGCDGAVIAVSATAALSLSEKLFIEERLTARKMPFLLVAITKLDLVPAGERVQVIRYIENKLKNWKMDIPVYIPYPIELEEDTYKDIIGMDKVMDEITGWVSCTERGKLAATWILGKASDIMENAASALREKLLLSEERDEKKREELILEKKEQLAKAGLEWGELRLQMQRRCTECYQMLLTKIDDYASGITERLQYEVSHANDLQKWWEEDFPYRIKVELTNMSAGVDHTVSRRVEEDARWYCAAIEKTFQAHVLFSRETIAEKQAFEDFNVGKKIEFEDLGKQRAAIKIGSAVLSISGFALLSSLGFMPMIATMGIGTGTTIFSEQFFKKKIEAQRNVLKEEIARCVPAFIEQAMEDSEKHLEAVYRNIIDEAGRSEQAWLDMQHAAMDSVRVSGGEKRTAEERGYLERIREQITHINALL